MPRKLNLTFVAMFFALLGVLVVFTCVVAPDARAQEPSGEMATAGSHPALDAAARRRQSPLKARQVRYTVRFYQGGKMVWGTSLMVVNHAKAFARSGLTLHGTPQHVYALEITPDLRGGKLTTRFDVSVRQTRGVRRLAGLSLPEFHTVQFVGSALTPSGKPLLLVKAPGLSVVVQAHI